MEDLDSIESLALEIFNNALDEFDRVVTWHVSSRLKMKTKDINRMFDKLVKKGILTKETHVGSCSIYRMKK